MTKSELEKVVLELERRLGLIEDRFKPFIIEGELMRPVLMSVPEKEFERLDNTLQ